MLVYVVLFCRHEGERGDLWGIFSSLDNAAQGLRYILGDHVEGFGFLRLSATVVDGVPFLGRFRPNLTYESPPVEVSFEFWEKFEEIMKEERKRRLELGIRIPSYGPYSHVGLEKDKKKK